MRELKFKGWDSYNNVMFNPGIILTDASHITFMQYTGLKDKNGVEIYEGDIIAPGGGYEDGECDHPSEAHWNEYNLQWEALCTICAEAVPLAEYDVHSVIGNIYEKKEQA